MAKNEIGIAKLNSDYNKHACRVLVPDFLTEMDRERGKQRRFEIVKPLPTPEEYKVLREKKYTRTMSSLVEDAFAEFDTLASELRDWYDNLPQSFQDGDKGSRLSESADTLEGLQEPDIPQFVTNVPVYFAPGLNLDSRSDRCSEAAAMLVAVVEALNDVIDDGEFIPVGATEKTKLTKDQIEELEHFVREIEDALDNAEGMDFPGMYD